ncbi:MAG: hypothetical protein ACYTFQ_29165 [Planctomycetota bacterium]|jgi:hypothetical protein
MPLLQLDTENADRDLTSIVTVLTDTPHATKATLCQGLVVFGDGAKNLDGTGGDFELTVTVGGQTIQPDPQAVTFSTAVRSAVWTTIFPVPANTEVILRAKSPNAADTDVDVTAYLYEVTGALPNAAPDAAGGLPVSDAGGLDMDSLYTYAVSSAAWGSINSGIVFRGAVTAADADSFTIGGLAGQGAGAFIDVNTPWYAYVFRDAGGLGAAPQGEQIQVTGYTTATGRFTPNSFTEQVAAGDNVIIMSGRIASVPDILEDTALIAQAFEEV